MDQDRETTVIVNWVEFVAALIHKNKFYVQHIHVPHCAYMEMVIKHKNHFHSQHSERFTYALYIMHPEEVRKRHMHGQNC